MTVSRVSKPIPICPERTVTVTVTNPVLRVVTGRTLAHPWLLGVGKRKGAKVR